MPELSLSQWMLRAGVVGLSALALPATALAQDAADDDAPVVAQDDEAEGDEGPNLRPLPGGVRPGPNGGFPFPQRPPGLERAERGGDGDDGGDDSPPLRRSLPTEDSGGGDEPREAKNPVGKDPSGPGDDRQRPPCIESDQRVLMDFVDSDLKGVVKYMAEITCKNFILGDDLKGEITIISHTPVSVAEAYEAFLSALQVAGYTTVQVGAATKVLPAREAANAPLRVYEGDNIPYTDNMVTQIFQLENTPVSEVASVVKQLSGQSANIIAYSTSNTLIVTDSAVNIRRMWKVVSQLDIASPKAKLAVINLVHAEAADVEKIIEEIYSTDETSTASSDDSSSRRKSSSSRRRKKKKDTASEGATSTAVGKEGKYIEKIISDERTNSIIVLANEEGLAAVVDLVKTLDVDVDPSSRAQIHVIYLEHAKAEDVANVLANLSEESSSSSSSSRRTSPQNRRGNRGGPDDRRGGRDGGDEGDTETGSATAALADGVKITSDENTNSLVVIASPESFDVIRQVVAKLDIRRKQVFVEAVIMELASEESMDLGVGYHFGMPSDSGDAVSFASGQLGTTTFFGPDSSDLLSGMAMGVFGDSIDVTVGDGTGGSTTLTIPAFGIALNALQADSRVNILSTPNILTLDNEEAKIVVGRNIPFPTSQGRDSNNNPIIQYSREDVAITLKVTPQINESDYVTLEVFQEVTEIEEDNQGLDVTSAGFITSKREAETTVLVKDNQTIVIGGLMGQTETKVETKIPVLGDLPLVGLLFRGKRDTVRKTNLLIFLTPHVIDGPTDLEEVYRVKVAQRNEFLRRFYGKDEVEQQEELNKLLRYSMNIVDEPSVYRTKIREEGDNVTSIGEIGESASGETNISYPGQDESTDEALDELDESLDDLPEEEGE